MPSPWDLAPRSTLARSAVLGRRQQLATTTKFAMKLITLLSAVAGHLFYALAVSAHEVSLPASLDDLVLTRIDERIYVAHGLQALPG